MTRMPLTQAAVISYNLNLKAILKTHNHNKDYFRCFPLWHVSKEK